MENKIMDILSSVEFEVIKEDNVATIKPKNEELYFEAAKAYDESLTKKTLKTVQKFEDELLKAGLETAASKAKELFKEDENIKDFVMEMPFGVNKTDTVHYEIERMREFKVPGEDRVVKKTYIKAPMIKKTGCKVSKTMIKSLEEDLTTALGIK